MPNPCDCNSDVHSFNWFNITGLPCNPCDTETFVCKYHYPAKCAILTVDLPCLELLAGTNLQDAFVALNTFVCNTSNIPFAGQDSSTIHWTTGGPAGHQPTAAVQVSPDAGNILVIHSNGLFVPTPPAAGDTEDWMVKVDSGDTPAFLEAQIIGGADVNSFLTITVTKVSGQLQIKPVFDIGALSAAVCELCQVTKPTVATICESAAAYGTFELGVPSVAVVQIPVFVTGSGYVTIAVTNGNGSFFGSTTQIVDSSTTSISCQVFYSGSGTNGTQNITVSVTGAENVITPCTISVEVADSVSCTHVTLAAHDPMPDAAIDTPYSYTLYLNGTQPFALTSIVKPSWATVSVVNATVTITGTPLIGDIDTDIPISFTVTNCAGAGSVPFSDQINVIEPVNYYLIGSYNYSIAAVSGTGVPTLPPTALAAGNQSGHHTGITGSLTITISGTGTTIPVNLSLSKNFVLIDAVNITGAGTYTLGPITALITDDVSINIGAGSV